MQAAIFFMDVLEWHKKCSPRFYLNITTKISVTTKTFYYCIYIIIMSNVSLTEFSGNRETANKSDTSN